MVIFRKIVTCVFLSFLCCTSSVDCHSKGRKGVIGEQQQQEKEQKQEWGYVTVRPHAHMFWWLYHTTAPVQNYTERPLIIWLQGGPGMPSSGYGNFIEIGPLDLDLNERNHTWVKNFNVLFVDNPVGVGYSYIDDNSTSLVKNNREIGEDLLAFMKKFMKNHRELEEVPLYIFGESYGGKMAVEFALQLHQAVTNGTLRVNLKGVGLGDAYISPLDYINNYAPLAKSLGFIDRQGYEKINDLAVQIKEEISNGNFEEASDIEAKITDAVVEATQGIDIYNILVKTNMTSLPRFLRHQDTCNVFMNKMKELLGIPKKVEWTFINDDIYTSLQMDLMQPVTKDIETLLNTTDLKIIVYNGALDFIVNTAGTANWLDNLKWKGNEEWKNKTQTPLEVNMVNEGYVRKVDNLVFYTVLRAGHSVPIDNPIAMTEILKRELLDDVS